MRERRVWRSIAAQRKFYADWQQRLASARELAAEDAADRQLMTDQIGLNLLELDEIQSYKHNPTIYVELIGNGLFLPLTQNYAGKEVRIGHVLSRMGQVPRLLDQVKAALVDADPGRVGERGCTGAVHIGPDLAEPYFTRLTYCPRPP